MSAEAVESDDERRAWWLRLPAVLIGPQPVFAALRDDSQEAASARQEQVLALILLSGVAGVLFTSVAGRLYDDPAFDGLLVAVWAFIGGGFYGAAVYWGGGALLYAVLQGLGSQGSYRRARHVVALSSVPLALSLLVFWPVRIAVYGGDLFRSGGSDGGSGGTFFAAIGYVFSAWAVALLVTGVRSVHGWTWARSAAAVGSAAVVPALLVLATKL
ncbi:MAG TPA: Yip1 family protein [Gaiellaceae bacterium]